MKPHDVVFFASPVGLRAWLRAETRERRLARLVEGCAAGDRLVELTGKPPVGRSG